MNIEKTTNILDERTRFAFEATYSWGESWRSRAVTNVKSIPVAIRTHGLTVTVATFLRRGTIHDTEMANLMGRWLLNHAPRKTLKRDESFDSHDHGRALLSACIQADRSSYQAAQSEAIALMELVKLFAEALYGVNE